MLNLEQNIDNVNKTMIFEIADTTSIDTASNSATTQESEHKKIDHYDETIPIQWTNAVNEIRRFVNRQIQWIAKQAATNPRSCVSITITISILMVVVGLNTNFNLDATNEESWLPIGSRSANHRQWILEESGFLSKQRNILYNIHSHGANIAGMEGAKRAFEVVDAVRNLPRYDEFCAPGVVDEDEFADGCPLWGVTQFWDHNVTHFDDQIHTDDEAIHALSAVKFPNGQYVHATTIMGNVGMLYGTVVFVQSYPIFMTFPEVPGVEEFELDVIHTVWQIQEKWKQDSMYSVEVYTPRSMPDELNRGIVNDIPLFPMCFGIMSIFVCIVFYRRDVVKSRTVLGIGAVISVMLAIMLAYGLMFCIGLPLSQMTQLLPFILFGIGLDDVFIVLGAYSRTDPSKDSVQRIDETMADIGSSIFLTTMTSTMAFAFGALSAVPIVKDLCHYAYVTIIFIFILQVTFFVSLIVLDEQRIQSNRRDCCACCITPLHISETDSSNVEEGNEVTEKENHNDQVHFADRIMAWYARQLLRPRTQITVLVLFGAFFASACYSVTQLKQEFDFTKVLPMDSYIIDYFLAATDYSQQTSVYPAIYFRCVDQSNEDIQRQMENYVDSLVALDEVEEPPVLFWLRDFKKVVEHGNLEELTFNEQLDVFLDIPMFKELYARDIVRDEITGDIIASRTVVDMNNVDQRVVDDMINALQHQRGVTEEQHINGPNGMWQRTFYEPLCEEADNWAFFMFEAQFPTWEFYTVAPNELLFTTIVGIVAVTVVGILLIPHWTVLLFIFPLITITYIDLLGLLQFLGATINAMTYVSMVMSIGLMVDFIMHVLLRYYECEGRKTRRERVIETLETMGASVVLGGASSLLGVLPLSMSTTLVVQTIFINFISLVVVGVTHGLILLPVILSLMGPSDIFDHSNGKQQQSTFNLKEVDTHRGPTTGKERTESIDTLTTDETYGSSVCGSRERTDSKDDSVTSTLDTESRYNAENRLNTALEQSTIPANVDCGGIPL